MGQNSFCKIGCKRSQCYELTIPWPFLGYPALSDILAMWHNQVQEWYKHPKPIVPRYGLLWMVYFNPFVAIPYSPPLMDHPLLSVAFPVEEDLIIWTIFMFTFALLVLCETCTSSPFKSRALERNVHAGPPDVRWRPLSSSPAAHWGKMSGWRVRITVSNLSLLDPVHNWTANIVHSTTRQD